MKNELAAYKGLQAFYGDIHNHCAVGYGHGSLEDAFYNARLQLDFASVTVHAHWADIPTHDNRIQQIVAFHQEGFEQTRKQWSTVQEVVEAKHEPGRFVTFLGYEWHSLAYGDHNIYYKQPHGPIIGASNLEALRKALRELQVQGIDCMLLPHHIGYQQGFRGINWGAFTSEFSPVVEIMSMHGASESPEAPYPYLHTMGPRDGQSLYQHGLGMEHLVGVMASTDHHSAHPGSYGHGCLSVWASDLTRDHLWSAIFQRRTVALTGDKIALQFALNDAPIGSVLPFVQERHLQVAIEAGSSIDYVDVVYCNHVIYRWNGFEASQPINTDEFKVHFEVGWAGKNEPVDWDVALSIQDGELISVEPRFRGHEIVAPQQYEEENYAFTTWKHKGNHVHFQTKTWGNLTTTTPSTQGLCLTVKGNPQTAIIGKVNKQSIHVNLDDLLTRPKSIYLDGFRSPVCYFHRAINSSQYRANFEYSHQSLNQQRDWYYIRVRQHNGQWAWSSPIWVEGNLSFG